MVERPIKKSERQNITEPSSVEEVKKTQPTVEDSLDAVIRSPEERNTARPFRGKRKNEGKGRSNQDDERSTLVNPALMRGPKPTKPKPPVIQTESVTESESDTPADEEITDEG